MGKILLCLWERAQWVEKMIFWGEGNIGKMCTPGHGSAFGTVWSSCALSAWNLGEYPRIRECFEWEGTFPDDPVGWDSPGWALRPGRDAQQCCRNCLGNCRGDEISLLYSRFLAIWCHLLFYRISAPYQGDFGLFPLVNAILGGCLFIFWLREGLKGTSKRQEEPGVTPQEPQTSHPKGLSPRSKPCPSAAAPKLRMGN